MRMAYFLLYFNFILLTPGVEIDSFYSMANNFNQLLHKIYFY